MKIDMSPKAVKARLNELNELWELSVKLMNNKKVSDDRPKNVDNAISVSREERKQKTTR